MDRSAPQLHGDRAGQTWSRPRQTRMLVPARGVPAPHLDRRRLPRSAHEPSAVRPQRSAHRHARRLRPAHGRGGGVRRAAAPCGHPSCARPGSRASVQDSRTGAGHDGLGGRDQPWAVPRAVADAPYAEAERRPQSERQWTLELPSWWVPTFTVAQRRALSPYERESGCAPSAPPPAPGGIVATFGTGPRGGRPKRCAMRPMDHGCQVGVVADVWHLSHAEVRPKRLRLSRAAGGRQPEDEPEEQVDRGRRRSRPWGRSGSRR